MITLAEAARMLGLSVSRTRALPLERVGTGRATRVTRESVVRLLEDRAARRLVFADTSLAAKQTAAHRQARDDERERQRAEQRAAENAARTARIALREQVREQRRAEKLAKRAAELVRQCDYRGLADRDGDRVYRASQAEQLAAELKPGDLLYSPPCALEERDPLWYDARKGKSPRWNVLVDGLARRGLRIEHVGAYYWEVSRC